MSALILALAGHPGAAAALVNVAHKVVSICMLAATPCVPGAETIRATCSRL